MTVADVARTGVMTAHRDQSAGNLATVMKEAGVGSVVIEDDDRPVGIVTDRDLAMEVLEPRRDPSSVTAADVMSGPLVTVRDDEGVFQATMRMHENSVRRMPVVDGDGRLAGIVTLDDLVGLLVDELYNLVGVVEAESLPY